MRQNQATKNILSYTLVGANLLMACVFCLALFSFDIADGGFSASYASQINNALGSFGALVADFCFSVFGTASYVIPFSLILVSSYMLYASLFGVKYPSLFYTQIFFGALSLLIGMSLLFAIYSQSDILPYSRGGIIGLNFGAFLQSNLGTGFGVLSGLVLSILGLSALLKFSWLNFMDNTGEFLGRYIFKTPRANLADEILQDDLSSGEEYKFFDKNKEFSQPLFDTQGDLIRDAQAEHSLDLRDSEEFLQSANNSDDIADFIDDKNSISTFTTKAAINSVKQMDIDKNAFNQNKKRIDEAVGFDFASYKREQAKTQEEQELQTRLDNFDKNFALESDDEVDFEFPEDFFTTQKRDIEDIRIASNETLTVEDFEKALLAEQDFVEDVNISSTGYSFNDIEDNTLDEVMYVADEFKYQPESEGVFMDKKPSTDFDNLSEEDKKAFEKPREFGYLNKSIPDVDKMQNSADQLYRAVSEPREYGYIDEPVESLEKMQKDTDTLYRAVSEPREYGYIDEPVAQLDKIQKIADKLHKAVSEPREFGYVDAPVEQLDRLQRKIDELYQATANPREHGYLEETVPQIAQLQAYADELYIAISQPREHGYLEETIPAVQTMQDDIDQLYLAVTQPREHGYIKEPVESLERLQKATDDVIQQVGTAGKKLDAVNDIANTQDFADLTAHESVGHLPLNSDELTQEFNSAEISFNLDGEGEAQRAAPSKSDFLESQSSFSQTHYMPAQQIQESQTPSAFSDFATQANQTTNDLDILGQSLGVDLTTQAQKSFDDLSNLNNLSGTIELDNLNNANQPESLTNLAASAQTPSEFLQPQEMPMQQIQESQTPSAFSDSDSTLAEVTEAAEETNNEPETKVWRVSDFQASEKIELGMLGSGDLPNLELLEDIPNIDEVFTAEEQDALIFTLKQSLEEFGVNCEVVEVLPGPVVTRFEIELAPGVKSSKVSALDKDIARAMKVPSVMVVEVTPGKSTVGIEIPNHNRCTISLHKQFASEEFANSTAELPLALGEDVAGSTVVANLAKMPHLLVAGTTGSGKSVGINAMLLSLLVKLKPEELRLILIDPKMLELAVYQGIPHLLAPVVTDMKQAANAIKWCVGEMENRYKIMAAMGVKNIHGYNKRMSEAEAVGAKVLNPIDENLYLEKMPYIVVVIDEFNDLLISVGKKVEELIARLAQKARASGIHLVLATQRPSVDVITGVIKANIPARIGFQVSTKIDSRTILDTSGAEQLLGNGDMLYSSGNEPVPQRVHGAYVSDDEVFRIAEDWRRRGGEPKYLDDVLTGGEKQQSSSAGNDYYDEDLDELYDEVVEFVLETGRPSASAIQRRFSIGYPRAARLIDSMEAKGLISALQSNGKREILFKAE